MKTYVKILMMFLVLISKPSQSFSQEQYPKASLDKNGDTLVSLTKAQYDSTIARLVEAAELEKRNKTLKESIKNYEGANAACDSTVSNLTQNNASKDKVIEETKLMLEDQKKMNYSDLYIDTKVKLDKSEATLIKKKKWIRRLLVFSASTATYIVGREYLLIKKARN